MGKVPDLSERTYVPFKIRLDVAGMPKGSIAVGLYCKFWISASKETRLQVHKRMRLQGYIMAMTAEEMLQQGSLAGLARPG